MSPTCSPAVCRWLRMSERLMSAISRSNERGTAPRASRGAARCCGRREQAAGRHVQTAGSQEEAESGMLVTGGSAMRKRLRGTGPVIRCLSCGDEMRDSEFERHRSKRHGFTPGVYVGGAASSSRNEALTGPAIRSLPVKKPNAAVAKVDPKSSTRTPMPSSRPPVAARRVKPAIPAKETTTGLFIAAGNVLRPASEADILELAGRIHVRRNPPRIRKAPIGQSPVRATFVSGGGGPGTGRRR